MHDKGCRTSVSSRPGLRADGSRLFALFVVAITMSPGVLLALSNKDKSSTVFLTECEELLDESLRIQIESTSSNKSIHTPGIIFLGKNK